MTRPERSRCCNGPSASRPAPRPPTSPGPPSSSGPTRPSGSRNGPSRSGPSGIGRPPPAPRLPAGSPTVAPHVVSDVAGFRAAGPVRRSGHRRRWRLTSAGLAAGGASAACDRRDDRDGLALGHRGRQSVEETDVLLGDEHVDEAAQRTRLVEETLVHAGVSGVEALANLPNGPAVDRDLAGAAGQGAQGGGDADGRAHR